MCVCVLSRFHEAKDLCKAGGSPEDWAELGKTCVVHTEVDLAIQIYRMCGNVGMVLSLQGIQVQVTCHMTLLCEVTVSVYSEISDAATLCSFLRSETGLSIVHSLSSNLKSKTDMKRPYGSCPKTLVRDI